MNSNEHQVRQLTGKGEGLDLEFKACRDQLPKSVYYGGADPELIEGDVFRMIVNVPAFSEKTESRTGAPQVTGKVGGQVGEQVKTVLNLLAEGAKSKQEILRAIGLSNAYLNYRRHIVPLIDQGLIAMTIPEKPQSRMRKYNLAAKGKDPADVRIVMEV